ncbi:MAG: PEP-CTERM sorting domain-containing protein [Phycisphaeraceae bacterium]|nr:PEP-CTERM sorting domain-containing protein [Phycisphaeraceae bacterium]
MNARRLAVAGAAAPAFLAAAVLAQPVTLYENTFEGVQSPARNGAANTTLDIIVELPRFAGRKSNESIRLKLTPPRMVRDGVPGDPGDDDAGNDGGGNGGNGGGGGGGGTTPYLAGLVSFDLYIIDSWDGSSSVKGPDYFEVLINREVHFSETFTNHPDGKQTYRAPDVGPKHLGYHAQWMDSIYRGVEVPFVLPTDASELLIDFRGVGLQGYIDESWGIDNIRVTVELVPAPGTLGALGLAGALAARRRRR